MEALTTMTMEGSAGMSPDSSAGAVLHFAAEQAAASGSGQTVEGSVAETTFGEQPPRYDQHWAIQGTHPTWVGFSSKTGLPR